MRRPSFCLRCCLSAVALLALLACAAPGARVPVSSKAEIEKEAHRQRCLALQEKHDMEARLFRLSYPLRASTAELSEGRVYAPGFMTVHPGMFQGDYKRAATEVFALTANPKIVCVADASPAQAANLAAGDEILEVNSITFRGDMEAFEKALGAAQSRPSLKLDIRRNGVRYQATVQQTEVADYPVKLYDHEMVNAFADGRSVYVTRGMMRFAGDDDHLAMVISHELAHDCRRHLDMRKQNRLTGGLAGAVLDAAAASKGVNTKGGMRRAGEQIGLGAYTKDMEREADYVGMYILARAEIFDIQDGPTIFRRLAAMNPKAIEQKYAKSHPATSERFVLLDKAIEEIQGKRSSGLALIPEEGRH